MISEKQVLQTIKKPDLIDYSRSPLLIAQRRIDRMHVLRVVFKREDDTILVITFYPGRVTQYERKS